MVQESGSAHLVIGLAGVLGKSLAGPVLPQREVTETALGHEENQEPP
jgi:hypothetical protein